MAKKRNWTLRELDFLRANCEQLSIRKLARELGRDVKSVASAMKRHQIKTGRSGHFQKGHMPHNKYTRGKMKPNKTSFRPGQEPHNTKQDGAISTRKDSNGNAYQFIRLSKGKWVLYHRHIWEQANGPIPSGNIVTFIDGNSMNCELANLRMITKAENAKRNHNKEKAKNTMKNHWKRVMLCVASGGTPMFSKFKISQEKAALRREQMMKDDTTDGTL